MIVEHRFTKGELAHLSERWRDRLRTSVRELPMALLKTLQQKLGELSILNISSPGLEMTGG